MLTISVPTLVNYRHCHLNIWGNKDTQVSENHLHILSLNAMDEKRHTGPISVFGLGLLIENQLFWQGHMFDIRVT